MLLDDLAAVVGAGQVVTGPDAARYGRDWMGKYRGAPLAVVRGRHRFRLLVKSARGFDLSAYLRQWLAAAPKPKKKLALEVDVDPQSFL